MTVNGTEREQVDKTGDGTFDIDELSTFANFTMTVTETFNTNCAVTGTTIVLNGTAAFEDKLNPNSNDNFSAAFTAFTMTLTTATHATAGPGEKMTTSGKVSITSSCANGEFTIETVTPFFFPDNKNCPIEGKILVTGGGATAAVIVNSDGSIDFDSNNDGTINLTAGDKHFATCSDSDVC